MKEDRAEEVAVGVGVTVEVGLRLGVGEAILPVTVAIGVMEILGISVGIDSVGVGITSVISSLAGGDNKLKGVGLILNIKKTPNADKISNIIVKIRYLLFLESIYL